MSPVNRSGYPGAFHWRSAQHGALMNARTAPPNRPRSARSWSAMWPRRAEQSPCLFGPLLESRYEASTIRQRSSLPRDHTSRNIGACELGGRLHRINGWSSSSASMKVGTPLGRLGMREARVMNPTCLAKGAMPLERMCFEIGSLHPCTHTLVKPRVKSSACGAWTFGTRAH